MGTWLIPQNAQYAPPYVIGLDVKFDLFTTTFKKVQKIMKFVKVRKSSNVKLHQSASSSEDHSKLASRADSFDLSRSARLQRTLTTSQIIYYTSVGNESLCSHRTLQFQLLIINLFITELSELILIRLIVQKVHGSEEVHKVGTSNLCPIFLRSASKNVGVIIDTTKTGGWDSAPLNGAWLTP